VVYADQGRYSEAELLFKRVLQLNESTFGPSHPSVAKVLNTLAALYSHQARYRDALPLTKRLMVENAADKNITLRVFIGLRLNSIMSPTDAVSNSYELLQRVSSSSAGDAISKLMVRFAAGTGELAQLIRTDQDLLAEVQQLDKAIISAASKGPGERNFTLEQQIRHRLEGIRSERDKLQDVFQQRFPDFAALSKPPPIPITDTQSLLADDEALVVFDFDIKS
jgi:hypothetical protein